METSSAFSWKIEHKIKHNQKEEHRNQSVYILIFSLKALRERIPTGARIEDMSFMTPKFVSNDRKIGFGIITGTNAIMQ
jgi:hypothetical protein